MWVVPPPSLGVVKASQDLIILQNIINILLWWRYYVKTNRKRETAFVASGLSLEQRNRLSKIAGELDLTDRGMCIPSHCCRVYRLNRPQKTLIFATPVELVKGALPALQMPLKNDRCRHFATLERGEVTL